MEHMRGKARVPSQISTGPVRPIAYRTRAPSSSGCRVEATSCSPSCQTQYIAHAPSVGSARWRRGSIETDYNRACQPRLSVAHIENRLSCPDESVSLGRRFPRHPVH